MQFDKLKRREFITLLGGAAAMWPMVARAPTAVAVRRVGILSTLVNPESRRLTGVLIRGLAELGWTEGRNIHFEQR